VLEQRASVPCGSVLPNGSSLRVGSVSGYNFASEAGQTSVTVLQANEQFPKTGVPESVRIQNLIQQTILAATNPLDPATRFSMYDRNIVPLPCPIPIDSINPAIPVGIVARRVCHLWPGT
jgi:hypothetical protein